MGLEDTRQLEAVSIRPAEEETAGLAHESHCAVALLGEVAPQALGHCLHLAPRTKDQISCLEIGPQKSKGSGRQGGPKKAKHRRGELTMGFRKQLEVENQASSISKAWLKLWKNQSKHFKTGIVVPFDELGSFPPSPPTPPC